MALPRPVLLRRRLGEDRAALLRANPGQDGEVAAAEVGQRRRRSRLPRASRRRDRRHQRLLPRRPLHIPPRIRRVPPGVQACPCRGVRPRSLMPQSWLDFRHQADLLMDGSACWSMTSRHGGALESTVSERWWAERYAPRRMSSASTPGLDWFRSRASASARTSCAFWSWERACGQEPRTVGGPRAADLGVA